MEEVANSVQQNVNMTFFPMNGHQSDIYSTVIFSMPEAKTKKPKTTKKRTLKNVFNKKIETFIKTPRKIFPQEACQASWQEEVELSANLVGGGQVVQHLFNHELGLAIRVGAAPYWVLLCQGKELWRAVHSGRT